MNDLISILIAVRDGGLYLREAIESALDQPGANVEVVVVDDGSTDGSVAVAQSFGDAVRLLCQEPLGIGPARNAAVAASTGAFLAFLDADDRFRPHFATPTSRRCSVPCGSSSVPTLPNRPRR